MVSVAVRRIAQASVVASVVAGAVGMTAYDKAVALSLDGKTSNVHVFGSTVGDLLEREGITVGAHDVVVPAVGESLRDGQTVVVRYGRKLRVTIDGVTKDYYTTASTVEAAMTELGIRADAAAEFSVSRSTPLGRQGLAFTVTSPKSLTLTMAGKKVAVTTTAPTVADVLAERRIVLDADDRVIPAAGTAVTDNLAIVVARITKKTVTSTQSVGYSTTRRSDSSLYRGSSKTVTNGVAGSSVVTYLETWIDGRLSTKARTATRVTKAPVTQVVAVGTKSRPAAAPAPAGAIPSSGGLNWAALARCESGGNPRAVNPVGYYGLYQFSVSTWRSVGGSGLPSSASSAEQTKRAQILYNSQGRSPWPVCGRYL